MQENKDPEAVRRRAMQDPEIQQIIADPAMQLILQQMQKDPQALREYVSCCLCVCQFAILNLMTVSVSEWLTHDALFCKWSVYYDNTIDHSATLLIGAKPLTRSADVWLRGCP